jgi:hypothetical protein
MPRGPKGQRRPADVIGNAVHVMDRDQASDFLVRRRSR